MADKVLKRPMARLREEIEAKGGIAVVPMWKVRDAAGWDRLGVNVVKDIASKMRRGGLATLPPMDVLPYTQNAQVRVYVTDGRVGEVIAAVLEPSVSGDKLLREIGADDASDVLNAVRELVCG
ncbi:hypothetical protein [Terrabacter terrigena]|uniref:Uncharacterized protein n=1 Tax=Terrabacter terrigena TaxID=574718 RepID=A0ABW3N0S7_9MICO